MTDRGKLLFEYAPPRAHPIVYAGLILFGAVWIMGSIENALRESNSTIYLAYGAPFVGTLLFLALFFPSQTRIYQHGIAPSRPLLLRPFRPFYRWSDVDAIYPSFYDVTGAFVSPFASSDGKVTQMGLAIETTGHTETVRFTPTRFTMWQSESAGYTAALAAVRQAWGDRPMVAASETFTTEEAEKMVSDASKPFLPFFAIVLLFASAAPVLFGLVQLGLSVGMALPLSLVAPAAVSLRSKIQSNRRHVILNRLSKAAEFKRGKNE